MKNLLRLLFRPLLDPLEAGEGQYIYKRSHRVVLNVMSSLFLFLAGLSLFLAPSIDYLLPVVVFGAAGMLGLVVGSVGKDIAVAKLWGSRER